MSTPSRGMERTSERLVVRYRLPDGGWQAERVFLTVWDDAELRARRRAKELRDEGRTDVEVLRQVPVL